MVKSRSRYHKLFYLENSSSQGNYLEKKEEGKRGKHEEDELVRMLCVTKISDAIKANSLR